MLKRKLDEAKNNYLKEPTDSNLVRYSVKLIEAGANEQALELLDKVSTSEKKELAILYKALAYRNLKDKEMFFSCINSITSSELMWEVYYEIANFYYLEMVSLKKYIKYKDKTTVKEELLKVEELDKMVRSYLDKSINVELTGLNAFLYGTLEYYDDNYDQALFYYLKILNTNSLKLKLRDLYFVKIRVAEIYLVQNNFDEAIKYTTELIGNQNYNRKVYILHAQIYLKKGDLKNAKLYYKKAFEKFGECSPKDYFDYGKICANLLDEEALEYFDKCKNTYYEPVAIQEKAKLFVSLGDYEKAKELYEVLLQGNEKDKNIAYIGIGIIYRKQNSFDEAKKWFIKALDGNEKDICLAYIELAKICEEEENFLEAEEYLQRCIKISDGKFGKLELARIKIKNDCFQDAKDILFEIKNQSNNKFDKDEAILSLALIERINGNTQTAIAYVQPFLNYESAIYYKAICIMIDCFLEENNLENAEIYLKKLENSKNKINVERSIFYQGEIARLKGNIEDAEKYYLKLDKEAYNKEQILFNIAMMNLTYNEKKFLATIEKLKNLSSKSEYMVNYLMAMYWLEKQDVKKATEFLIRNIATKNSFKAISLIILARNEEINGNFENAIKYYNQIILDVEKFKLQALFKLGKIYLKFGEYEESRKYFIEVLSKNGKYSNLAKINLAVINSHQKNYAEADKVLLSFEGTKDEIYAKFELAKSKIREEKYKEALEIFRGLENSVSRKYVLLETARIKNKLGLHKEAFKYLNALIEEGDSLDKRLALAEKARAFYDIGEFGESKKIYLDLLRNQTTFKVEVKELTIPENLNYMGNLSVRDELLIELSRVERKLGNTESAIKYLFMVGNEREKIFAISELIDIETERKNYSKALEYVSLIENTFLKESVKIKKTTIYLNTGNYEKLHKTCEELNCSESKNIKTYRNAIGYFCEEKFSEAKRLFESLLDDNEFKKLASFYLGKISLIEKDFEMARVYFQNRDEEDYSKLRQLLIIDIHQEKYDAALDKALLLFNNANNYGEKENISFILNFLSYKLNIILPIKYYGARSIYKDNIFEYNKNQMYTHIYNQATGKNEFNKRVDILLLLDMLEQGINKEYFLRNDIYDEYAIPIENIGKNKEGYLKVLTIPNTSNVISIYPSATKYELFDEYIKKRTRN